MADEKLTPEEVRARNARLFALLESPDDPQNELAMEAMNAFTRTYMRPHLPPGHADIPQPQRPEKPDASD